MAFPVHIYETSSSGTKSQHFNLHFAHAALTMTCVFMSTQGIFLIFCIIPNRDRTGSKSALRVIRNQLPTTPRVLTNKGTFPGMYVGRPP
jgi:hypothetical protein